MHTIVKINDIPVSDKTDALEIVKMWEQEDLDLFLRDLRTSTNFHLVIPKKVSDARLGMSVNFTDDIIDLFTVKILQVIEGSPAQQCGLLQHDYILGVEGIPMENENKLLKYIEKKKKDGMTLLVFNEKMNFIRKVHFIVKSGLSLYGCKIGLGVLYAIPGDKRNITVEFDQEVINRKIEEFKEDNTKEIESSEENNNYQNLDKVNENSKAVKIENEREDNRFDDDVSIKSRSNVNNEKINDEQSKNKDGEVADKSELENEMTKNIYKKNKSAHKAIQTKNKDEEQYKKDPLNETTKYMDRDETVDKKSTNETMSGLNETTQDFNVKKDQNERDKLSHKTKKSFNENQSTFNKSKSINDLRKSDIEDKKSEITEKQKSLNKSAKITNEDKKQNLFDESRSLHNSTNGNIEGKMSEIAHKDNLVSEDVKQNVEEINEKNKPVHEPTQDTVKDKQSKITEKYKSVNEDEKVDEESKSTCESLQVDVKDKQSEIIERHGSIREFTKSNVEDKQSEIIEKHGSILEPLQGISDHKDEKITDDNKSVKEDMKERSIKEIGDKSKLEDDLIKSNNEDKQNESIKKNKSVQENSDQESNDKSKSLQEREADVNNKNKLVNESANRNIEGKMSEIAHKDNSVSEDVKQNVEEINEKNKSVHEPTQDTVKDKQSEIIEKHEDVKKQSDSENYDKVKSENEFIKSNIEDKQNGITEKHEDAKEQSVEEVNEKSRSVHESIKTTDEDNQREHNQKLDSVHKDVKETDDKSKSVDKSTKINTEDKQNGNITKNKSVHEEIKEESIEEDREKSKSIHEQIQDTIEDKNNEITNIGRSVHENTQEISEVKVNDKSKSKEENTKEQSLEEARDRSKSIQKNTQEISEVEVNDKSESKEENTKEQSLNEARDRSKSIQKNTQEISEVKVNDKSKSIYGSTKRNIEDTKSEIVDKNKFLQELSDDKVNDINESLHKNTQKQSEEEIKGKSETVHELTESNVKDQQSKIIEKSKILNEQNDERVDDENKSINESIKSNIEDIQSEIIEKNKSTFKPIQDVSDVKTENVIEVSKSVDKNTQRQTEERITEKSKLVGEPAKNNVEDEQNEFIEKNKSVHEDIKERNEARNSTVNEKSKSVSKSLKDFNEDEQKEVYDKNASIDEVTKNLNKRNDQNKSVHENTQVQSDKEITDENKSVHENVNEQSIGKAGGKSYVKHETVHSIEENSHMGNFLGKHTQNLNEDKNSNLTIKSTHLNEAIKSEIKGEQDASVDNDFVHKTSKEFIENESEEFNDYKAVNETSEVLNETSDESSIDNNTLHETLKDKIDDKDKIEKNMYGTSLQDNIDTKMRNNINQDAIDKETKANDTLKDLNLIDSEIRKGVISEASSKNVNQDQPINKLNESENSKLLEDSNFKNQLSENKNETTMTNSNNSDITTSQRTELIESDKKTSVKSNSFNASKIMTDEKNVSDFKHKETNSERALSADNTGNFKNSGRYSTNVKLEDVITDTTKSNTSLFQQSLLSKKDNISNESIKIVEDKHSDVKSLLNERSLFTKFAINKEETLITSSENIKASEEEKVKDKNTLLIHPSQKSLDKGDMTKNSTFFKTTVEINDNEHTENALSTSLDINDRRNNDSVTKNNLQEKINTANENSFSTKLLNNMTHNFDEGKSLIRDKSDKINQVNSYTSINDNKNISDSVQEEDFNNLNDAEEKINIQNKSGQTTLRENSIFKNTEICNQTSKINSLNKIADEKFHGTNEPLENNISDKDRSKTEVYDSIKRNTKVYLEETRKTGGTTHVSEILNNEDLKETIEMSNSNEVSKNFNSDVKNNVTDRSEKEQVNKHSIIYDKDELHNNINNHLQKESKSGTGTHSHFINSNMSNFQKDYTKQSKERSKCSEVFTNDDLESKLSMSKNLENNNKLTQYEDKDNKFNEPVKNTEKLESNSILISKTILNNLPSKSYLENNERSKDILASSIIKDSEKSISNTNSNLVTTVNKDSSVTKKKEFKDDDDKDRSINNFTVQSSEQNVKQSQIISEDKKSLNEMTISSLQTREDQTFVNIFSENDKDSFVMDFKSTDNISTNNNKLTSSEKSANSDNNLEQNIFTNVTESMKGVENTSLIKCTSQENKIGDNIKTLLNNEEQGNNINEDNDISIVQQKYNNLESVSENITENPNTSIKDISVNADKGGNSCENYTTRAEYSVSNTKDNMTNSFITDISNVRILDKKQHEEDKKVKLTINNTFSSILKDDNEDVLDSLEIKNELVHKTFVEKSQKNNTFKESGSKIIKDKDEHPKINTSIKQNEVSSGDNNTNLESNSKVVKTEFLNSESDFFDYLTVINNVDKSLSTEIKNNTKNMVEYNLNPSDYIFEAQTEEEYNDILKILKNTNDDKSFKNESHHLDENDSLLDFLGTPCNVGKDNVNGETRIHNLSDQDSKNNHTDIKDDKLNTMATEADISELNMTDKSNVRVINHNYSTILQQDTDMESVTEDLKGEYKTALERFSELEKIEEPTRPGFLGEIISKFTPENDLPNEDASDILKLFSDEDQDSDFDLEDFNAHLK